MKIFIFDLDGVLVKPRGYHLALKETVRLAGESLGYRDAVLTDSHIARYESLGISSEWHSSALSMAIMQINKKKAEKIGSNFLPEFEPAQLFEILSGQDINLPALERGLEALRCLAGRAQVSPEAAIDLIINSESIKKSPTFNWFQEMILGTDGFENTYGKNGTLETSSFLKMYDQALLSKESREKLFSWLKDDSHFASIMTNRPSSGPPGFSGAPDAGMAAALTGVENLPLVGFGEIQWLAQETNSISGDLCKPNYVHALAAILLALGCSLNETTAFVRSQDKIRNIPSIDPKEIFEITVFEDTPGGFLSVEMGAQLFCDKGYTIKVRKMGIAKEVEKTAALSSAGGDIFPDINSALKDILNAG